MFIFAGTSFGARPLRRWLEQIVITDLSRMVIAGDLPENSDVVCDAAPRHRNPSPGHSSGSDGVVVDEPFKRVADGHGLVYRVSAKPEIKVEDLQNAMATDQIKKGNVLVEEPSSELDMDYD